MKDIIPIRTIPSKERIIQAVEANERAIRLMAKSNELLSELFDRRPAVRPHLEIVDPRKGE